MTDGLALALALVALAATLAVAVTRPPYLSEALAAGIGAAGLVTVGAIGVSAARHALGDLGPTVGFLAAMLLIADGCRREGVFDAAGAVIAGGAHGSPRRLLAFVFVIASVVTAVLSLDATIVLLTPVVFATAARMRTSAKAPVYACTHLANSASLLLPVSNLTNLLAFHAVKLSFVRFVALMALPTAGAVAVEWLAFGRFFATELGRVGGDAAPDPIRGDHAADPISGDAAPDPTSPPELSRFALGVLALTLAGFALSSALGIAPVWVAVAGAVAITAPALVGRSTAPAQLVRAAQPGFLAFVLGLGVIVQAASARGLHQAVRAVLPAGGSLPDLLAVAALSAVLANLVNNLPATLILVPVAATGGTGPVLASLIGVNVGPNLTYVGSLATLLWRRVLHAEDVDVALGEFTRLGVLTVPAALLAATGLLWLALRLVT